MFKKDDVLIIHIRESDGDHVIPNSVVVGFEDGLLKVNDGAGAEIIYNVHSAAFIKATKQK